MKAVRVRPGHAGSAQLDDLPEPDRSEGTVLVETVAVGICGTDREILGGFYGTAPPGRERLVLGHESVARVVEAPQESGLKRGDVVAGIVRRPDPCRVNTARLAKVTRVLQTFLFGVTPTDPIAFTIVTLLLNVGGTDGGVAAHAPGGKDRSVGRAARGIASTEVTHQ